MIDPAQAEGLEPREFRKLVKEFASQQAQSKAGEHWVTYPEYSVPRALYGPLYRNGHLFQVGPVIAQYSSHTCLCLVPACVRDLITKYPKEFEAWLTMTR